MIKLSKSANQKSLKTLEVLTSITAARFFFVASLVVSLLVLCQWSKPGYIWFDEIFSIWATDTDISVLEMQARKLSTETNPPLFFWLFYIVRMVISDPVTAGRVMNAALILVSSLVLVAVGYRFKQSKFGFYAACLYLLSADTFVFNLEIRPALLAISECTILATYAGFIHGDHDLKRRDYLIVAVLSTMMGLTQVYAALFAVGIGASLALNGWRRQLKPLLFLGLTVGVCTTAAFGLWYLGLMASTHGALKSVAWIKIDRDTLMNLVWCLPPIYVGLKPLIPLYGLALGFLLTNRPFRQIITTWLPTMAVFFIIPWIISIKQPIILWRYFAIGACGFQLLSFFTAKAAFSNPISNLGDSRRFQTGIKMAAIILVLIPVISGFFVANHFRLGRPDWAGAGAVQSLGESCLNHVVRITPPPGPLNDIVFPRGYQLAIRNSDWRVEDSRLRQIDVSDINCKVLGWQENDFTVTPTNPPTMSSVLLRMNLTNRHNIPLRILPHRAGYILLK